MRLLRFSLEQCPCYTPLMTDEQMFSKTMVIAPFVGIILRYDFYVATVVVQQLK